MRLHFILVLGFQPVFEEEDQKEREGKEANLTRSYSHATSGRLEKLLHTPEQRPSARAGHTPSVPGRPWAEDGFVVEQARLRDTPDLA